MTAGSRLEVAVLLPIGLVLAVLTVVSMAQADWLLAGVRLAGAAGFLAGAVRYIRYPG